jgi:hypothetical protein
MRFVLIVWVYANGTLVPHVRPGIYPDETTCMTVAKIEFDKAGKRYRTPSPTTCEPLSNDRES